MKRLRITQLWLFLVALAIALPAWSKPPQPGIPIVLPGSNTTASPFRLEAGTAYAVGWLQQRTFLNVTISLEIKGKYRAYLTENIGPQARKIAAVDGPPADGEPLFQPETLGPGSYFVVVVRRKSDTDTTWEVAALGNFEGATIRTQSTLSATSTANPDNPYQADFTLFSVPGNARPRFSVTAQWTHDPSAAYGPDSWGTIGPPAETCGFKNALGTFRFGLTQSPIDIRGAQFDGSLELSFSYPDELPFVIENRGNTIEVPVDGSSQFSLTYNGDKYKLTQFHVHAPSEHTLDGQSFGMEVHLVHENALGQLAVVGVLLDGKDGAPQTTGLDMMIENAPESVDVVKDANKKIKVDFVTEDGDFFFYNGSLTTPPCTEGVTWIVSAVKTKTISSATLTKLHDLIKKFPSYNNYQNNNRPVVDFDGRKIFRRFRATP